MLCQQFRRRNVAPRALNGILAKIPPGFCEVNVRPSIMPPLVWDWENGALADDRENILIFGRKPKRGAIFSLVERRENLPFHQKRRDFKMRLLVGFGQGKRKLAECFKGYHGKSVKLVKDKSCSLFVVRCLLFVVRCLLCLLLSLKRNGAIFHPL